MRFGTIGASVFAVTFAAVATAPAPASAQSASLQAPAWTSNEGASPSATRPTFAYAPRGPMSSATVGAAIAEFETDPPGSTRGEADPTNAENVFAGRCRSVALIMVETEAGVGSGTGSVVTAEGMVLTAAHVVKGAKEVLVGLFPDCRPGTRPTGYAGKVVKVDDFADLAVVQIAKPPAKLSVMPLGNLSEVRPGSTVLMIGHPRELLMSLSRGLVSAVRPQYQWEAGDGIRRQATVIQTDGAINPGNSGGPMLSTSGNLIGVSSFISGQASAGLNFAVSVTEVREFFGRPGSRLAKTEPAKKPAATSDAACEPRVLSEGREGASKFELIDLSCRGKANAKLLLPDDKSKPAELWVDRNGDGKGDVVYFLSDRNGTPDYSMWDDSFSGKFDWRGEHLKGEWEPFSKTKTVASR